MQTQPNATATRFTEAKPKMGSPRLRAVAVILSVLIAVCSAAPVQWEDGSKLSQRNLAEPEPPTFPEQYEVKYEFSMPYTLAFQATPLSYDVHLWYDGKSGQTRVETLGGLDLTLDLKDVKYEVVPAVESLFCIYWDKSESTGPKLGLGASKGVPANLTDWQYGGKAEYEGRDAHVWSNRVKMFDRVEYYKYYISTDGHPLFLSVMGQDWFSGSHFDQYIVKFDYDSWKPGPIDPEVFATPATCIGKKAMEVKGGIENAPGSSMQALIPRFIRGDPEYDLHSRQHGRTHSSPAEYYTRLALFQTNKLMVDTHNEETENSFSLALNRFADWSEDEFRSVMLGRRGDKEARNRLVKDAPQHEIGGSAPPESFSWQGEEIDGVVKDQASCGSCWTFGAVSAMESAWYLATGQRFSFSEQQIVDCAWPYGVYGCDGGWSESAIQYVTENGGIMTEDTYRYIGQDDWCRFNTTEQKEGAAGFFSGFKLVPKRDLPAIKDALYTKGPLAVAIDASDPKFRFYTGGVYYNPECSTTELDHVVTLVGYGSEDDTPYFTVRNSWSKFWGNEGYIKMAIKDDCGIMTDAVYAIADAEKAKEARGENWG